MTSNLWDVTFGPPCTYTGVKCIGTGGSGAGRWPLTEARRSCSLIKMFNFRDEFWTDIGRERVHWREPFHTVSDCDLKIGKVNWFLGGKLNVSGAH